MAEQPDLGQAVLLQYSSCSSVHVSMLFVFSQARPQEPGQVHDLPVLPMCARLHLPRHNFCRGNSHLSKEQPWNIMRRQLITSDAKSAPAGQANAVQAEFSKPGMSTEVTQKVLRQYKTYLSWDMETKLRPALQLWLQELGTEQLSEQLCKLPHLLVSTPKKRKEAYSWLMTKGVSAARIQQKAPMVLTRELMAVQSTFEALQQAAAFSDEQMCTLLHKHSVALAYGPERVLGTLQAVSALLGMPMKSDSFREVILAASDKLFFMSPITLHQRVAFFCHMYATGTHVAKTAFTTGVFVDPEPVMQARAAKLQEQLGWDSMQLKQKLSAFPSILNSEPSTIARNLQAMQGLHLDKIAVRPRLLAYSVSGWLGPRVWFLYQTGAIEAPNTVMTSGLFGYINHSQTTFSKTFSAPSAFPSMVFDSAFIDHWKRRWEFLRQHMKLSVETIAAHQDLLLTSLPDRLAIRWWLLSSIAKLQAGFKAEDHLTALATLSDQDFAQVFRADEPQSVACTRGAR
ncbi:TPA: hypothetical protein ACH3X2_004823 [Trebouxia sp. C0005]